MIQRIQSVYLLLVVAISVAMFYVPIGEYEMIDKTTSHIIVHFDLTGFHFTQDNKEVHKPSYICMALNILVGVIALLTIFIYKRRKHQVRHCWFMIFLLIIELSFINFIIRFINPNDHASIGAYLPIAAILLCFLAKRAIKKDDELVRSVDRLR